MSRSWDRRSPRQQHRVQSLVLSQWIPAAAAFSPFWGAYFAAARVDPGTITSPERLRQLPPLRERDILDADGYGSPALLMRPTEDQVKSRASLSTLRRIALDMRGGGTAAKRLALLREYKPVHLHPSGRDGDLTIAYSRSDLDRLHRLGARAAAVLGLDQADYLVSAVPADGTLAFWGVYHLALGASLLAVHPRGTGQGLGILPPAFRLVPATAVAVPVEEAIALADTLSRRVVDLDGLATVVLVGPPPSPGNRKRIAEAWRTAGAAAEVRVAALWAPPGARALWAECAEGVSDGAGSGLHTYPDLEVVELVDPATRLTVAAGGDLTYTSAGWHGTGLIRYQTGDYAASLLTGPCPACGRTVPRVQPEIVPGAWEPELRGEERPVRVDLRGAAVALTADPAVDAWLLEVRGPSQRRARDEYVVMLAGELDSYRLVDLDRRLTTAVGRPPLQLIVEDRELVEADITNLGGAFIDAR
ncbi:MAG: hypothetical protein M3O70_17315 [Actinomycetota bacterium]|nr:hypothetical protein [Actinomycetota bacterium]